MTLIYKGVPWSLCVIALRWRCKLCSGRMKKGDRAYRPMNISNGVKRGWRICEPCVLKIKEGLK